MMRRYFYTMVALVALFSLAACNNISGPTMDRSKDNQITQRGGDKDPQEISASGEVITPDPGNGSGGDPVRRNLNDRGGLRRRGGQEISPGAGDGSGGGDVGGSPANFSGGRPGGKQQHVPSH